MKQTDILYFGKESILICDERCEKAWGISSRPRRQLSENPDDFYLVSDNEFLKAPHDPGTYEGGEGKVKQSHNKWCVRECERSVVIPRSEIKPGDYIELPNWNKRRMNLK